MRARLRRRLYASLGGAGLLALVLGISLGAFAQGAVGLGGLLLVVVVGLWLLLRSAVLRHFVRPLHELLEVTEAAGQEEHTRRFLDAAPDAVVMADTHGVIVDWNAAAHTMFGWSREEAIGMTLAETLVPEDQRREHLGWLMRVRERDSGPMPGGRREVTVRRRSGEVFPAEITVTVGRSPEGVTLSAFVRDLTDRRRSEAALRTTEDRFRRLLETASVVPWEADSRTTRVTFVGPQAEQLLGFPLSEWYEEGFWVRQVHEDDRGFALAQLAAAAEAGEPCEFEYRLLHRDGQAVWVRDLVSADVTSDGAVLHGFRFDVTERRRLEEELLQASKMEAVGRLAGGIAHDFNNTLTSILGYASLLETSFAEGAPERADLAEIRRAAGHAADLTQQLLAFARKQVIRPRVLVVDDLVRRLEKMIGRLFGEDIDVATLATAGAAAVWVDAGRLEQALVNLALNARDAMPRGGVLSLGTAMADVDAARAAAEGVEPGPYAMISVADTGVGMDRAARARAFEPFFTTKREGKGTGLGLSMAYGVVRQAGGFFEVDSQPGRGSTFRAFLPLSTATARTEEPAPLTLPARAGDETILLAEDDSQVRRLTERGLLRAGYRVLVAQNGVEAVEKSRAHEGAIHLLLTDVVMPAMGGVRAADIIRGERPGIRVLFVSGYSEESLFRDGVEEGVHFLSKPFTPLELDRRVREILDGVTV